MIRFLILFLFFSLHGLEPDDWSVISSESEPSLLVEGKVNALTGKVNSYERDLIIQGAEPIVISRIWSGRDWEIFPLLSIEEVTPHHRGHAYLIREKSTGAQIRYKFTDQKVYFHGERYRKYIPSNLNLGYTNTSKGVLSSRTHLQNNVLYVGPKEKTMLLHCADGTIRTYRRSPGGDIESPYHLLSEHLPNGNWVLYEYEQVDKKHPLRLAFIRTTNPSQTQIYAEARFIYQRDKKHHQTKLLVFGNDGQMVEYISHRSELTDVKSSSRPDQHLTYYPFRAPLHYFTPALKSVSFPTHTSFQLDFYTDKTQEVNGIKVALKNHTYETTDAGQVYENFAPDPRCGRVLSLSAPVGSDASLHTTHSFLYDLDHRKTSVVDLENQRIDYQWDDKYRLQEIAYFSPEGKRQKAERFAWSSNGLLLWKMTLDEHNTPFSAKRYTYTAKGDVAEEQFYGNLSGKGPPLVLKDFCTLVDNGAETYTKRFTYFEGDLSLLRSIEEDEGKRTEFSYLPNTDLVTSQTIYAQGHIQEHKEWEYNADHLLIRETTKTPTTTLIKQITPKPAAPYYGMPWILEEKDGQGQLIKKTVLHYTEKGGRIAQADLYDATGTFRYSLFYKYDFQGHLIEQSDPLGQIEQFGYDIFGNQTFHRDISGRKTATFQFDCSQRKVRSEQRGDDQITLVEESIYDKKHRLIYEKKPLGQETHFRYNSAGHLIQKQIHSHTYLYENDTLGRPLLEIDPEGFCTKTSYNAYHQPIRKEHPDGSIEEFLYFPNGLLKEHINSEGVKTSYTYNYLDQITSKQIFFQDKLLLEEKQEYNGPYLLAKIDAEGQRTSFTYDSFGRIASTHFAEETLTYQYDPLGRCILEKKGDLLLHKEYDLLDRLLEERKEANGTLLSRIQYTYDAAGKQTALIRFIDGQSAKTQFTYDSLGRCTATIDPLGNTTKTLYTFTPYLKETLIDPGGLTTIKEYDAHQNLLSCEIADPSGSTLAKWEATYNFRGQLREQHFLIPRSYTHLYTYNKRGQLVEKTEAANHACAKKTQYLYDKVGRLTQKTKPDGVFLHYTYDPLGHLLELHSSDQTIHYTFTYDRLGRRRSTLDLNTQQKSEKIYDARGNVLSETLLTGPTLSYQYDLFGRRTQLTLPDASSIRYTYDALYLRSITRCDPYQRPLYSHLFTSYDLNGNSVREVFPEGKGELITHYNLLNQKEGVESPYFTQSVLERDVRGNILHYTLNGESLSFTYDELSQIQTENDHTYLFDAEHCRLQKDQESYIINPLHQVISHCTYDLNGNPLQQGQTLYFYDALDRLIRVQTPEETTSYTYDADHRLLSKTSPSEQLLFLYDGAKEIGALDVLGNLTELRLLNPTHSSEIGAAVLVELQGAPYLPLHDLMGNVCHLTPLSYFRFSLSYTYTAFGEESPQNDRWNPWRYASKRKEGELIYFGRRFYDPRLGRWLTPDPAESTGNLYAFVQNNPLRYLDLFGLYTTDRASDVHYFDPNYPQSSNFSLGTLGDPNQGTVHYHCGIANLESDVKQAQQALFHILEQKHAIEAHWIHNPNLAHGLSLVAAEKLKKKISLFVGIGPHLLGTLYVNHSYIQDVIDYEFNLLTELAGEILAEKNPRLKQVHLLFSNASYSVREALLRMKPEERNTVILISSGPTTLIENELAHKVYNIIGEKDYPSKLCNRLLFGSKKGPDYQIDMIEQTETQFPVFGHYFMQPEYQKNINKYIQEKIKLFYEIY